ncbi:lipase member I [Condylostylus longicornis]|uniref:lipase member I n=1 Tax=Condylostylus longicornis TaxID=2530218 RepID=UPI00244E30A7|nr:lipase member I [Condylostylus longicornis]XP_055376344.1 lipase member I [Condylostylus longicornis]
MKAIKNKRRLLMGLISAPADMNLNKFLYFYGPAISDVAEYDFYDGKRILQHEKFDKNKKTVLYLHGYLENREVESVQVIADAYLCRSDINIIIVDWGELADGNYLYDAVPNAKQLGPQLSKVLLEMFENGLNIEKFHIVGHSLGGQVAGMIGREIIDRTKGRLIIPRITALDPAFPPFYYTYSKHICKTDAKFVDIMHTDAWLYGSPCSTGHADFWPNGGKTLQPGCPKRNYKMLTDNDLSSHRRSWWFWAESISNKFSTKFEAVKSKSWNDFKTGKILPEEDPNLVVYMGEDCPLNITGDYYLQTNGETPFAKGLSGTKYIDKENEDAKT